LLDKVAQLWKKRRGSTGPTMGQEGGNDQCKYPRIQEAIENHPNFRMGEGVTRAK
jgi:hypothetical protein